jgi:hypothetical protein
VPPSLTITTTSYTEPNKSSIDLIRQIVFCHEQGVDPGLDQDGLDDSCVHALAYLDAEPIATGRIQGDGHIGRIAVMKDHRKIGVGSKVVLKLIEHAKGMGLGKVYLASQVSAVPFYRKLGFSEKGSVYVEANIDHINMEKMI